MGVEEKLLKMVRVIADYQFGRGAGKALFPDKCKFVLSPTTGKVRQIKYEGVRLATLKADTGLFTLSIEGAKRLHRAFDYPKLRVVVLKDVAEFIAKGRNVFAKHVVNVDESIRANDEVLVVDEDDNLLATGRAVLSAREMMEFDRGMAVMVRQGIKQ
ncbi:PUA domain-containing protein [Archaeoglobus profundus]|uniref:PUA domain containing protein n=1 Tax=Archaeoglobus profundus (strain DSM 5631 / JCM 9629 / NBRC 100127 / Av18) TaxID=572546 RepID=D2RGA6_ARCPA|nr:PUA domain-containing protein [Archaeoglobus profundus]ADB57331.1 PUA domain containing protein [Archaeoglobus profundus DSM 5631]